MGRTIAEWYVQEGQLRALRKVLRIQSQQRFQTLPEALQQRIEATTDVEKLESCIAQVLHSSDPKELQL